VHGIRHDPDSFPISTFTRLMGASRIRSTTVDTML